MAKIVNHCIYGNNSNFECTNKNIKKNHLIFQRVCRFKDQKQCEYFESNMKEKPNYKPVGIKKSIKKITDKKIQKYEDLKAYLLKLDIGSKEYEVLCKKIAEIVEV